MVKKEFEEEMGWFCEYYNHDMPKTQTILWFSLLNPYNKNQLHEALISHIKNDEFPTFPAFGKIYKYLMTIVRDDGDREFEEWKKQYLAEEEERKKNEIR